MGIISAMKTWNPAMWAGLSAMAAMLATGGQVWWIWMPASAICVWLMIGAVAATISPPPANNKRG